MAEPFFESVGPVQRVEPQREESAPVDEPFFESVGPVRQLLSRNVRNQLSAEPFFESVGPVIEQATEVVPATARGKLNWWPPQ